MTEYRGAHRRDVLPDVVRAFGRGACRAVNPVHCGLNAFRTGGAVRIMQNRDDMLAVIRAEVEARAVREGPGGSTLSFDGRQHFFTAVGGAWEIRFELEQLGAGEVVGVGSIWTPARRGAALSSADVIVSGRVSATRRATLVLDPVVPAERAPVRLVVRLAEHVESQEPVVSEVIEVHGMPA